MGRNVGAERQARTTSGMARSTCPSATTRAPATGACRAGGTHNSTPTSLCPRISLPRSRLFSATYSTST
ncbi:unnamed protein product, partial [Ectocarpus sp. 4 AP-2014]